MAITSLLRLLLLAAASAWTPSSVRHTRSVQFKRAKVDAAESWFGTHAEKFANDALALWSADTLEPRALWDHADRGEEYCKVPAG